MGKLNSVLSSWTPADEFILHENDDNVNLLNKQIGNMEHMISDFANILGYDLNKSDDDTFSFDKFDGTDVNHPLTYTSEMYVYQNKYYTNGTYTWKAKKDGTPIGFYDTEYFDVWT